MRPGSGGRLMTLVPARVGSAGIRLLAQFRGQNLVRNIIALYGIQFCRKIVPLIAVPYLAKTLGPAGWGAVAFAQAFGDVLVLVIEFGFNLSATRDIAQTRDRQGGCGELVASIVSAQIVLALIAIAGALVVSHWMPMLSGNPRLLTAALVYGVAQGLTPVWFFQGFEKMNVAAALEVVGKLISLGSFLLFVHTPDDTWKALMLQAAAPVLSACGGLYLAFRMVPFCLASPSIVLQALTRGWNMFLLRSGITFYGTSNALILGFFAPPQVVGYFAVAEKISKAAFGLLTPIREGLFPRLSNLVLKSPEQASRLFRAGAVVTVAGGFFLTVLLYIFAPWIIGVMAGPGFEAAVTVLRILSILPTLIAITDSVGLQSLLPLGNELIVNRIIFAAGIVNAALAFVLAPRFGHLGMAYCVVISELLVCLSLASIVSRSSLFSGKLPVPAPATSGHSV